MKKLHKYFYLAIVPAIFILSGFALFRSDIYFEIAKNIDIFTRVYKEISFNYVDEINPEKFLRAGIKGMLSSLDPYTMFIDEKRKEDIDLLTTGKYGGVGITIGVRDEKVTIIELMDGYSAQRQGLQIGDVIYKVDSVLIQKDNFEDISLHVKGEPGTFVKLSVVRNENDTIVFNLVREEIVIKNIAFCDFFPENSNNLYIKLTGFNRGAGEELKKSVLLLRNKKEIKSVVLDLRGNPGGLLDAAVDISSKFLKKGDLVVFTKSRDTTNIKYFYSQQEPLFKDVPVSVLVNGGSASASEIVAGAIQDHDRGIILGTKTFGKGLVQTITPLSYNTSLKITTSKYYTPSGRCIQKIDYSMNNDAFISETSSLDSGTGSKEHFNKETAFTTDHNRIVYSSGGITPDSVIDFKNDSEIVLELLAKGSIFKFANSYYEKNKETDFNKLDDNKIFDSFLSFIKTEKIEYKGKALSMITSLKDEIKKMSSYDKIQNDIDGLIAKINKLSNDEIVFQKSQILTELKSELANRYLSKDKAYLVRLKMDKLVLSSVEILSQNKLYNNKLNTIK